MYLKYWLFLICIPFRSSPLFAQSNYQVTNHITVDQPVSPLLYSSFIELGWGRSTDNMWSELLYNRSFEEDEARLGDFAGGGFVKDVNPGKEDWWHSGYEAAKWYLKKDAGDTKSNMELFGWTWPLPGHGKRCTKIFNKSKDKDVYLCQDSVYLRRNVAYSFEGLLNNLREFTSDSVTKESVVITVCLFKEGDFSKPLATQDVVVNTGYFKNYTATLPAFDYEGRGTFAIKVHPGTKVNVDLLSLSPSDNINGWRKDVIAAMRDSVPVGTIRFPGGCFASTYNWKEGIGDKQNRKMIFGALSDGGGDVIQDVGTVEFLDLCRLVHTVPVLAVPVMLNTADNAAEWVSFCNSPKNALRHSIGRKEIFNVKYWEMDNEPYRRYDPITYAHKCVEFAKAMKKVDPSIKIIMAAYFTYGVKLKQMLDIAGPYIDLVNKREDLPFAEYKKTLDIIDAYNKQHHTSIKMCDTETTFPAVANNSTGVDGLNHDLETDGESTINKAVRWAHGMSLIKNYIKFQDLGGNFVFANLWAYINSYGENLLNVTKEKTFVSAMGRGFQFLEKADLAFPVQVNSAKMDSSIQVQAGWNRVKNKFTLIVLNFSGRDIANQFDFSQLKVNNLKCSNSCSVFSDNMKTFNNEDHPDAIKIRTSLQDFSGLQFQLSSAPNSATCWIFDVTK